MKGSKLVGGLLTDVEPSRASINVAPFCSSEYRQVNFLLTAKIQLVRGGAVVPKCGVVGFTLR